ncbi:hypothetical protein HGRIS_008913 [Hohenbuehelia grisea]|uniref:Uncharacterized protein n=1 Tax=Hohenbuehelia grisea TaxID=104357 RepID=A0ABR3IZM9_9AGAR
MRKCSFCTLLITCASSACHRCQLLRVWVSAFDRPRSRYVIQQAVYDKDDDSSEDEEGAASSVLGQECLNWESPDAVWQYDSDDMELDELAEDLGATAGQDATYTTITNQDPAQQQAVDADMEDTTAAENQEDGDDTSSAGSYSCDSDFDSSDQSSGDQEAIAKTTADYTYYFGTS